MVENLFLIKDVLEIMIMMLYNSIHKPLVCKMARTRKDDGIRVNPIFSL